MFIYDKKELIRILKANLEYLENTDLPEKFKMCHTFDTGGYTGDCEEIYDFDFAFSYDKEDNVLFFEYFGDENPGTPGIP